MKKIMLGLLVFMSFFMIKGVEAAPNTLIKRQGENSKELMWSKIDQTTIIKFTKEMKVPKTVAELEAEAETNGDTYVHPAGMPEYTGENWDVSEDKDKSVMAYWYRAGTQPEIIDDVEVIVTNYLLEIQFNGALNANKDSSFLFANFSELRRIFGLEFFKTEEVINMQKMFYECKMLNELKLDDFQTQNVTNMASMFEGCSNVTILELPFDTSNVTNMASMFAGCRNLDILGTQSFNISKVTQMQHMFDGCQTLGRIVINNFDPSNVTDMSYIFNNCSNLIELVFGPYFSEEKEPKSKADNLTNMSHMFAGCTSLKSISVGGISGSKVVDMSGLFKGSKNMTKIDFGEFDTSNVTNMASMFEGVEQLTYLDLSNFNTSNVTNMSKMFDGARSLETLDLNSFNTSSLTNTERMFANTKNLETINFESAIFDNDAKNANMLLGTNQNLVIFVKDNDAKDFILRSTLGSSFNESNIQLRNTSNDTSSSSSISKETDKDNSSSSTKNTGPVDNPKTGILSMGIIFGLFIIASTVYILFKKDKLFKQI